METLFAYPILEETIQPANSPAEQFHDLISAAASSYRENGFWIDLAQAPLDESLHIATDPYLVDVHLSREQWENKIVVKHPEVDRYREHIFRAITMPDLLVNEGFDEKNRYHIQYYANLPDHAHEYQNRKRVVVIAKYVPMKDSPNRHKGLISTTYLKTY